MIFCATCKYYLGTETTGTCLAPLPYWISVDRAMLAVSCEADHRTARKCMCYRRKGEDDAEEED